MRKLTMSDYITCGRIHITGGAGSGKTTLAQQLSKSLNAPCYDLDRIGYVDGKGLKRPLDVRLTEIENIITQPIWITEGAFLWWTDRLMQEADRIVWLDLPFRTNAWRIVKRYIQFSLKGSNPHPGIYNLVKFLCHVRERQTRVTPITPKAPDDDLAITRAATAQILSKYSEKVVHCKNSHDVAIFLTNFANYIDMHT